MKLGDRSGCIVSWLDPEGHRHVRYEAGELITALEEIVRKIPDGSVIQAISTAKSMRSDLAHSRHGGRREQYAFERPLLEQIGRLDLLPEGAR